MGEYMGRMCMKPKLLLSALVVGLILTAIVLMFAYGIDNNTDQFHMDGWGMMDWWGIPYMGFMMIGVWLIFVLIAYLVYSDAERRGMNGLLWFMLVLPSSISFFI